ncbi:MAG: ABC transporter permease [Alphaproteobacteria bacterium]|nr:ABC transporter permease [Alphaproteobacteria bacterium]
MLTNKSTFLLLLPLTAIVAVFFLYPLGLIVFNSVNDGDWTLRGYEALFQSRLIAKVLQNTFEISVGATLISLALGYPIAMHLARQTPKWRAFYMILVMLPFWTSILVKSFALAIILGENGLINNFLGLFFGPDFFIPMMFNRVGVFVGMVNYLLPFMILPILTSLMAQDPALRKAAEIMGAGPARIFLSITLPQSLTGIMAGVLMNLVLSLGMYITPALLGGRKDVMMANLIDFYTRKTLDWQLASAIAVSLLVISIILAAFLQRSRSRGAAL